jgi:hypothetical protein
MTKQIMIKSGEFSESTKVINVVVQEEWYSIEQCRANPRSIYIFGDNLLRVGEAGQASIRSCNNAIGIATKKKPSMEKSAFFSDKEYDKLEPFLKKEMDKIINILFSNDLDTLVFPRDGLGTGLSKLPQMAPKVFLALSALLYKTFNIHTDQKTYKLSI